MGPTTAPAIQALLCSSSAGAGVSGGGVVGVGVGVPLDESVGDSLKLDSLEESLTESLGEEEPEDSVGVAVASGLSR